MTIFMNIGKNKYSQQKIYCIWQIVLNMKMIAINKHSNKLKDWNVEMPNAPYSNSQYLYLQIPQIH